MASAPQSYRAGESLDRTCRSLQIAEVFCSSPARLLTRSVMLLNGFQHLIRLKFWDERTAPLAAKRKDHKDAISGGEGHG